VRSLLRRPSAPAGIIETCENAALADSSLRRSQFKHVAGRWLSQQ